jgi:protein-tyrosine-phosphatase
LRHIGKGKFKAFSCGVPGLVAAEPTSWTLLALQTAAIPADGLDCKSWAEFSKGNSPKMDFVISLDAASAIKHPMWPGQPETALWDYPEPIQSKGAGQNIGLATVQTLLSLRQRLEFLVSIYSKVRNRTDLRHDLRDLAHM